MRENILYGSLEIFNLVYGWRPCCKFYANVEKICNTSWRKFMKPRVWPPLQCLVHLKVTVVPFCTFPFIATSQKALKCI
jgi:hypothetical protein